MSQPERLAIFHGLYSASIFDLLASIGDRCRILWVTGWSTDGTPVRVLRRLGDVVDVSGLDAAATVERIVAERPDGLLVSTDEPIRLAAAVAAALGLPFHSPRAALRLTDKLSQRRALAHAGVSGPAFAPVRAGRTSRPVPLPAVLKPREGAGSRDTYRVDDAAGLDRVLALVDPAERFILEQWLPDRPAPLPLGADVVSVETVLRAGEIEHVAVTGRLPFSPPFRETGSFLPSDLGADERAAVLALASEALAALDLRDGLAHTEIKLTPDGPRVVEVNGRIGGGIDRLVSRLGGPSLLGWAARLALGDDVGPLPALAEGPVSWFRWVVGPPSATVVTGIEGVDALRLLPGVEDVKVNRRPGDRVDVRQGSPWEHVVRAEGCVGSHEELATLVHERIPSTLRISWG